MARRNSTSEKQNCLLKNFLTTLILMTQVCFYLHSLLMFKLVKKVIINFDLSQASRPDCIQVVVLKNCESELSYILAKLFNIGLGEFCFP